MMSPLERHLAVINGEEPDRVDILFASGLRGGPNHGMLRRLIKRGMGISHIVPPYKPMFFFDHMINPFVEDVSYSQKLFMDNHVWKIRHALDTPVGELDSIVGINPDDDVLSHSPETFFIKKVEDWQIINFIFEKMIEGMVPNYKELSGDQADLGSDGITIAVVDKTPFQRAWIELAGIERTAYDIKDKPDLFLEYLDIQNRFHKKAAEITAGCSAQHITLIDNITNVISPKLYREYCSPYYDLYTKTMSGTGKKFAVHHDGLLNKLKDEIHDASFDILDSFTIPPTGDVSLIDAQKYFPEKILAVNLIPHLAYASMDELHEGYEKILEEHGKKCLIIEHVEDLPEKSLENHLTAALDVCGY